LRNDQASALKPSRHSAASHRIVASDPDTEKN
jgi:hypothetical protein